MIRLEKRVAAASALRQRDALCGHTAALRRKERVIL